MPKVRSLRSSHLLVRSYGLVKQHSSTNASRQTREAHTSPIVYTAWFPGYIFECCRYLHLKRTEVNPFQTSSSDSLRWTPGPRNVSSTRCRVHGDQKFICQYVVNRLCRE